MSGAVDVAQVDARMLSIWRQRDVSGKPVAIQEINKLLDVRLLLTRPDPQYVKCGECQEMAVARAFTSTSGPLFVIDCPRCDRSRCTRCKQLIVDRRAKRCPKCTELVAFTPDR